MAAPAEDSSFPSKIRITSYPAREYAGMIFGYLGEGEPPPLDLARHPELECEGSTRWIQKQVWPCNWLQSVENSLDAAPVSFVHRWGRPGSFGAAVTDALPNLEYVETESGIRQIATRSADNVRISDWTFPNHNHIVMPGLEREDPWSHTIPWMVPVDDEHVLRVSWQTSTVQGEAAERLVQYLLATGFEPTENPHEFFGRNAYCPEIHHDELLFQRRFGSCRRAPCLRCHRP